MRDIHGEDMHVGYTEEEGIDIWDIHGEEGGWHVGYTWEEGICM